MSARLIRPLDSIEVSAIPLLIYGPPGVGKTSIAQTAESPVTLDFDKGIHRSQIRKDAFQFDSWQDVLEAGEQGEFRPYKTLVVDTGGRALDLLTLAVLADNSKNGFGGVLSQQGWGHLGRRFSAWVKLVTSWGKDLVFVCHQEEDKNAADQTYFKPDFPGKMAYKEIHKSFDLIGRVFMDGRKRYLDFSPRDNAVGKNAAGFDPIETPDLSRSPTFLADLILRAKLAIGKTAEASAATAKAVEQWTKFLGNEPDANALNDELRGLSSLPGGAKVQAWALIQNYAKRQGWTWEKDAKRFTATVEEGAVA